MNLALIEGFPILDNRSKPLRFGGFVESEIAVKWLIKGCILLLLSGAVACPVAALELGATAPDFTLPDLDGKAFRLSDLRGRIVVLKLATTWCPSCREQSQVLAKADALLAQRDVAVVEVFLQDSADMVRGYLRENPVRHAAVLLDDDRVRRAYNVYLIPRVIVIDREFRLQRDGSLMLRQELEEVLRRVDVKEVH